MQCRTFSKHGVKPLVIFAAVTLSACGGGPAAVDARAPIQLVVAPEDGASSILGAIRGARRRVLVEMYLLTADDAVAALLAAHDAGCDVRVLLEAAPYGDEAANRPAFAALAEAGVDVRWVTHAPGLVHTKLIVVDDITAFVLTLNLTRAGLDGNREYAVADADPLDVRWAQAIWNADALGADPGPPPARTRLLASPIDARPRLAAQIDGARASLSLEIEEISDTDLVGRLLAARARGVATTVVAPGQGASSATVAALARLATGGVTVRALAAPPVHAKALVVDGRQLYVGSVNFTRASLDDNREVGVVVDDPRVAARVGATIAADAAAAVIGR